MWPQIPEDLTSLSAADLKALAAEIRKTALAVGGCRRDRRGEA